MQAPDSTDVSRSWWSETWHRQKIAGVAAVDALKTGFALLVSLSAALGLVSGISGLTQSVAVIQSFGVNPFDHITFADLPVLGLRFSASAGLALGVALMFAMLLVLSTWIATLAALRHQAEARRGGERDWLGRLFAWLGAARKASLSYLLPFLFASSLVLAISFAAPAVVDGTVSGIRSPAGCVHYVIWNKKAGIEAMPFSETQCAALVTMLGDVAIFHVTGQTHVVPRSAIASYRIEARTRK